MAINRYDVPAEIAVRDQFYQLPFEQMAAALASRQGAYDETEAGYQELALKQFQNLTADDPKAHAARQWQAGLSDVVYNDFDGDFSQGQESLRRAQKQVAQRFGPAGDIGAMESAVAADAEMSKNIDEAIAAGTIDPITGQKYKQHWRQQYIEQGGIGEANDYGKYQSYGWRAPAENFDFTEFGKQFSDWKADIYENIIPNADGTYRLREAVTLPNGTVAAAGSWYNPEDGYLYKDKYYTEIIPESSIMAEAERRLVENPDYKAWVGDQVMLNPHLPDEYEKTIRQEWARSFGDQYGNEILKYDQQIHNNVAFTAAADRLKQLPSATSTTSGQGIGINVKEQAIAADEAKEHLDSTLKLINSYVSDKYPNIEPDDIRNLYLITSDPEILENIEDPEEAATLKARASGAYNHVIQIERNKALFSEAEKLAGFDLQTALQSYIEADPIVKTGFGTDAQTWKHTDINQANTQIKEILNDPTTRGIIGQGLKRGEGTGEMLEAIMRNGYVEAYAGTSRIQNDKERALHNKQYYVTDKVKNHINSLKERYDEDVIAPINNGNITNYVKLDYIGSNPGEKGYTATWATLEGVKDSEIQEYFDMNGESTTLAQAFFGKNATNTVSQLENIKATPIIDFGDATYVIEATPTVSEGNATKGLKQTVMLKLPGYTADMDAAAQELVGSPNSKQREWSQTYLGVKYVKKWDPVIVKNLTPNGEGFKWYSNDELPRHIMTVFKKEKNNVEYFTAEVPPINSVQTVQRLITPNTFNKEGIEPIFMFDNPISIPRAYFLMRNPQYAELDK